MKTTKRSLRLLLIAIILASLGACGFSNAPLIKAGLELTTFKSFRSEPELDFDMQLRVPDFGLTMDIDAAVEGRVDFARDPLRVSADLILHLMGVEMHLLAYGESSPEVFDLWYSLDEGDTWEHTTLERVEEGEPQEDASSPSLTDMMALGKSLRNSFHDFVKVGTEDVKGSPALRYDASFRLKALDEDPKLREGFYAGLAEALQREPEEMEALIDLGSLDDIPLSLWLDQESGRLVKAEMDLGPFLDSFLGSGLMNALIAEQLGLEDFDMEINVAQTRLSATLSKFNELDPADFVPPAA